MSGEAVAAVLLAGAAGAVLPGGQAPLARLRGSRGERAPAGGVTTVLSLATVAVVIGVLPALATAGGAVVVWRLARRRSVRRAARRHREGLGELLAALRAELRSGADPRPAMAAAAAGLPGLGRLAGAATSPVGDVRRELERLGALPGGRPAADLAAAWHVAELTGCGLAGPVHRVLSAHRADARLRRELAAQLAGPTATARLLTALPVAGVAMGVALGADPVGFLLGPGPGRACLLGGLALLVLGDGWTRSMTRAATKTFTGAAGDGDALP